MTAMSEVTLKEYFESRLADQRAYFEERLRTMNENVGKASLGVDQRLASMNEWRASLNDLSGRMATKQELAKTEERIKAIELINATAVGRTTVFSIVWAVISSVVVGLVMKLWILK